MKPLALGVEAADIAIQMLLELISAVCRDINLTKQSKIPCGNTKLRDNHFQEVTVSNKLLFPVMAVTCITVGTLEALAQSSMTGGGTLTFGRNSPEIVELADGGSLLRTSNSGVYVADDPTGPFHLATQDCRGPIFAATDDSPPINRGYCDCIDADGDVFWISYTNNLDTGSWQSLGGTGKFAGMEGGGSIKFLLNLPDGRLVLRWDGTWEMP